MINVKESIIPTRTAFAKKYRLIELLNFLGNPERRIPTINVVGTNGKGSTTMTLATNLKKHYLKVGSFISPAFIYHNERIRINDQMISDQQLLGYLAKYNELIHEYELTFFEVWTFIMILYFAEQKVDIAVIEAGIGGMKDATSVMTNQLLVALTSLSLDHVEVLGSSITEILEQKLGIAKKHTPIFISADNYSYKDLIDDWANQHPTNQIIWGTIVDDLIDYQKANKGLVTTIFGYLQLSKPEFNHWPLGRFTILQEKPYHIIIDGAHNEGGLDQLLTTLKKRALNPIFLFASSQKKDYQTLLKKLKQNNLQVYVTNFAHPKAWTWEQIKAAKEMIVDWKEFLQKPLTQDLMISGSLYFIAQVYEWWIQNH